MALAFAFPVPQYLEEFLGSSSPVARGLAAYFGRSMLIYQRVIILIIYIIIIYLYNMYNIYICISYIICMYIIYMCRKCYICYIYMLYKMRTTSYSIGTSPGGLQSGGHIQQCWNLAGYEDVVILWGLLSTEIYWQVYIYMVYIYIVYIYIYSLYTIHVQYQGYVPI